MGLGADSSWASLAAVGGRSGGSSRPARHARAYGPRSLAPCGSRPVVSARFEEVPRCQSPAASFRIRPRRARAGRRVCVGRRAVGRRASARRDMALRAAATRGIAAGWERREALGHRQAAGFAAGARARRRRDAGHEVDRRHRGPVVVHAPAVREVSPAGQRQGPVLAPAGEVLRRRGVVPARRSRSPRPGRASASCCPWSGRTGRRASGSTTELVGSQRQPLGTPHEYDLGTALAPGKHRLTIRVDNRLIVDVGPELPQRHATTRRATGTASSGGSSCAPRPPVWIDDVQVYPDVGDEVGRR